MYEPDDFQYCPHCDGVTFSANPDDAVTVTEHGVRVDPFTCLTCGAGWATPHRPHPRGDHPRVEPHPTGTRGAFGRLSRSGGSRDRGSHPASVRVLVCGD